MDRSDEVRVAGKKKGECLGWVVVEWIQIWTVMWRVSSDSVDYPNLKDFFSEDITGYY